LTGGEKIFVLCAFLVFLSYAGFTASQAWAEKIRTAIPQATLNYLSVYVAEGKGFFKEEGLENETIVIGGPLAIAALVSGDVDYSGAGGSGMRAAIKGAQLKVIMFQTEKMTWYLVAHPSIAKVSDLKGKKVAVGTIGDSQDRFTTMFIERGGLSAKDVTRISMGPNASARTLAIKSGAIQAAVVDPGGAVVAEKEGLSVLVFLGDLFPFPFQGFAATDKKIAENPAQVKRWLRAMVRALMFLRERPEEAVDIGIKKLQLGNVNRSMLLDGIKRYVQALPEGIPGLPSPEGVKNILEYEVRIPMQIEGPFPAEKLLHLKLVEEVKREMEMKGARK
jgi:ABC-type nitrate/sulfonate/bicarbonate transport system substrate-binding protein